MEYTAEEFIQWRPVDDGFDIVFNPPYECTADAFGTHNAYDLHIGTDVLKFRPGPGVLYLKRRFIIHPGDVFAHFIPGEDAERKQREERQRRLLEAEKKEIATRLKEKHRRRQLEKIVEQELIDSGELFGEQPKRPPIPRAVVDAVYKRDGGRCVYCGSTENLQLDHIIPFSKGGATTVENLQLLCQKCNLEKSNKIG